MSQPRFAVIPFSTGPSETRAALAGRGLALELIEWLRHNGVETVLLTATRTDDDGQRRALVSFTEPMEPQTIADIVAMEQDPDDEEEGDVAQGSGISTVISGQITLLSAGLSIRAAVTDTVGVYSKGQVEGEIAVGDFPRSAQKLFSALAQQAGVENIKPYDPGTKVFKAWEHLLMTRALKLAAELGVLERDMPQPFREPLAAVKLDPGYKAVRERAGELALTLVVERGFDPTPALRALDAISRAVGHDWKSWRVRGQLLSASGRHAEAARSLIHLIKGEHAAPDKELQVRVALEVGREFNLAGRFDDAERFLKHAMGASDIKVDAIVEMASAHLGMGQTAIAERLWQRALELEPENIAARLNLAHLYRNKQDAEKAAAEYAKLLEAEDLPRDLFAEAAEFFFANQLYDTALAAAEQFVEEYPGDAIAHVLAASALNAKGRHKDAAKALDQAELCAGVGQLKDIVARQRRFAEHPDGEKRLRELAELVFGEDQKGAEDGLKQLLADYPDFWEARMLLGITLRRQERWADARDAFEKAREGRDLAGADKELTGIYAKLGQPEKALECAKRAAENSPEDAEILSNYAAALLEAKDLAEAYKQAKKAEELDPQDPVTRKLLDIIESKYLKRGFVGSVAAAARYLTRKFRRKKK